MSLAKMYEKGEFVFPEDGRYLVQIKIHGSWLVVLEKRIKENRGTNRLPVFLLRRYSIRFMEFVVESLNDEVLFVYDNGLIVDKLKYVDGKWLGKMLCNGKTMFWFFLVPV